MKRKTQLAVIGGGHAGIEAALAAARMGVDTVLFTISMDGVANMPCNPSVGGTAKGHLVFEIDALGGEMGRAADLVTLQSRTLNTGKGAAVQSKRIQADRRLYQRIMKHTLEVTPHLHPMQAEIVSIETEPCGDGRRRVTGVTTAIGEEWECDAVVVATGTYLDSRVFVGDRNYPAGPDGFLPAAALTRSLADAGVSIRRFKTGTPPRVLRHSIDFSRLEVQPGEEHITPFSALNDEAKMQSIDQIPCHIVYTNAETHRIIRENLHRSAMYSGQIHGTGPRYCPSIEDKIVRFADKERHQLFVEPLGPDTEEMYIQGFSTSTPPDVQDMMLRSLPGFENAVISRYAYAIEYDCADPLQLRATLEFRDIDGLCGAGQFNGTSGYEEAAAQGLVAGINAALKLRGEEPLILRRSDGYIGTLIDDLVTKGTNEPYRMMTSRSEFRLLLRQDNADERLTPMGRRVGLISDARYDAFLAKKAAISDEIRRLEVTHPKKNVLDAFLAEHGIPESAGSPSLADLLRRPGLDYYDIAPLAPDADGKTLPPSVVRTVEANVKYEGYIKRQLAEVRRSERLEGYVLPADLDYSEVRGLRIEARQKLDKMRPMTLGQASRISGVSPADISVLLIRLGLK